MLDKNTNDRIAQESIDLAEIIWGKFPAELPNTYELQCVGEMRRKIAAALEAEAERAQGLVAVLLGILNDPMTSHYVSERISETLNRYNNSK